MSACLVLLNGVTVQGVFAHMTGTNFEPTADREVQRILLELLNQMDGFDQSVNVKVRRQNFNLSHIVSYTVLMPFFCR